MKRKEIICLLAGCLLFLAPFQSQAANLPDLLSIGTIGTEITGSTEDLDESEENRDSDDETAEDGMSDRKTNRDENGNQVTGEEENAIGDKAGNGQTVTDAEEEEADTDETGEEKPGEDQTLAEKRESSLKDILGDGIGSGTILESTKTLRM